VRAHDMRAFAAMPQLSTAGQALPSLQVRNVK